MTRSVGPSPLVSPTVAYDLVIPEGLHLDWLTVTLLARRLADAGPEVTAVVARPAPVPAGSSARVLAERAFTRTATAARLEVVAVPRLRAAGVVKPGSPVTVADGDLLTGDGGVRIDPAAVAADLDATPGLLVDADPTGRPVFTRQPLVMIALGHDASDDTTGWAVTLADALLGHDTEARLAVDATVRPTGGGRTTACALSKATMAALRPDVVVTVDDAVRRRVEPWCTERYTTMIEVIDALDDRAELVSWRHGEARGRVRARIGPQVPATELAALVARLCGGPPPVLPLGIDALIDQTTTVAVPVRSTVRRRAAGPIRSVAVIGAPDGPDDRRRWAGVAEQFTLVGCTVAVDDTDRTELEQADLVVCGGRLGTEILDALAERQNRGARTVALIGHRDVLVADSGLVTLQPTATSLAQTVGRALVPSEAVAALADHAAGWQARHLPTAVGWERITALQAAGTNHPAGLRREVCWILDPAADPTRSLDELTAWLDTDPSASLIVATDGPGPEGLADHPQVRMIPTLDAVEAAGATAVMWSPAPGRAQGAGEILEAVELALAGVPVLAEDDERSALGGLGQRVAPPTAALLALGSTEARHRGRRLHDRAAALHGAQSAAVHAHRMLGWLLQGGDR